MGNSSVEFDRNVDLDLAILKLNPPDDPEGEMDMGCIEFSKIARGGWRHMSLLNVLKSWNNLQESYLYFIDHVMKRGLR